MSTILLRRGSVKDFKDLDPNVFVAIQTMLHHLAQYEREEKEFPIECRRIMLRVVGLSCEFDKSTVEDLVHSYRLAQDEIETQKKRQREEVATTTAIILISKGTQGDDARRKAKRRLQANEVQVLQEQRRPASRAAGLKHDIAIARNSTTLVFNCPECSATFDDLNVLTFHRRYNCAPTPLLASCPVCHCYVGNTQSFLVGHSLKCNFNSTGMIQCPCDCSSKGPSSNWHANQGKLLRHIKSDHALDRIGMELLMQVHDCSKCLRRMVGNDLPNHFARCRVKVPPRYRCLECCSFGQSMAKVCAFASRKELQDHKRNSAQHKKIVKKIRDRDALLLGSK